MSIFQHPLLLVFFSFLLCPVASQPGQKAKEVKSGQCTSAELVGTAADCQAAATVLGLGGTVQTEHWGSGYPPGCSWYFLNPDLYFNTDKASTGVCGDGTFPNFMCLCVDPCPIGNYQNEESSKTCKSCLAGTYNDETGQALCKSCPKGWGTTSLNSTACTNFLGHTVKEVTSGHCPVAELIGSAADCQAAAQALGLGGTVDTGSWDAPPGCIWQNYGGAYLYFNTNKVKYACGTGTISNNMCICVDPCPIGNYQNEESSKTCKSCLAGTYNDETGQALCKSCPKGWDTTSSKSTACTNFLGHTVNEVKSGHCISAELIATAADCQAAAKVLGLKGTGNPYGGSGPPGCIWYNYEGGYLAFNNNTASTHACSDGTDLNHHMCLCVDPCPIGSYQNEESIKTCKSCLAGTYNDETGHALCKKCIGGRYSSEVGQTSCKGVGCSPGKYLSEVGTEPLQKCKSCPAGTYSNEIGKALCKSCREGHYQPSEGKINCDDKCVAGSYSTESGASSCTKCLKGTASTTIAASTKSTCIKCIGGQYSTEAGASLCSSCLKGTYSAEVGQSTPDICKSCQAGAYSNVSGATQCQGKCIAGQYSTEIGQSSRKSCKSCQAGAYSNKSGADSCQGCIPGKYSNATGQFSSDTCKSCIAGTYSNAPGASS